MKKLSLFVIGLSLFALALAYNQQPPPPPSPTVTPTPPGMGTTLPGCAADPLCHPQWVYWFPFVSSGNDP